MRNLGLISFMVLGVACAPAKNDAKGEIDDSPPPAIPTELGKGDASSRRVAVDVESAHPYANHVDETFAVPLVDLPSCATEARLHFSVLRTEAGYDHVTVDPSGAPAQSFDGNHDDTWTEWFPIAASSVRVRLETDGSITRHGFEIDAIEWAGGAICPAVVWPACPAGTVDVAPPPGVCGCPPQPVCASLASVEVRHATARGFNYRSHNVTGEVASETRPGPADGPETHDVGTVAPARVAALLSRAVELGVLQAAGYDRPIAPGAFRDELAITAGPYAVTFVASEGAHDADVQQIISDFEALFQCEPTTGAVTCGSGYTCQDATCVREDVCVCPAIYDPVCTTSGQTFSNGCAAACANVEVAHAGECGITGDPCGTILGLGCLEDHKCRFGASQFTYPYPDAGGACVAANYCDAPADCEGLIHIAVPGAWACEQHTCAWQTGISWKPVTDGGFETPHPYANGTSVWKELWLPAGAQALRLTADPGFSLEAGYDFLEVWTWQGGAWQRVKRYTGTAGPTGDELPGRYHYLRFVSDSSITRYGFRVTTQWR